jgi:23S rRNA G2445 N2-methylase RlmL
MSAYLTSAELRELTGRARPEAQVAWLRRNAWNFALPDAGRPLVLRAYRDYRMGAPVAAVSVEQDFEPNILSLVKA